MVLTFKARQIVACRYFCNASAKNLRCPRLRMHPAGAFPVKTAQARVDVCGTPTEFHVSVFSDKVLVVITQNGKPGTVMQTQKAKGMGTGARSFETKVLIGKRDDWMLVYAKRIAESVAQRTDKPLVLTLCVLDESPEVFKAVMDGLSSVAIW